MALDCNDCVELFEGIARTCGNNHGGIKKLYLTELCNVSSLTLGSPTTEITAITMSGAAVFYEFEFIKNTSTFTDVGARSDSGGYVYTQTINLQLSKREKTKRDTLALLATSGKELVAIVKDANDLYWYLGETNGLTLTENNSESGTAKADFNGYNITFVGEEPDAANTVEESAVTAVLAA